MKGWVTFGALATVAAVAGAYGWNYLDAQRQVATRAALITGGDPGRGRQAVARYGCGGCHSIPRVPQASGLVGPPLAGIGGRVYLAGRLENTPENMVAWIAHPRAIDPQTAMPDLGVTPRDAHDIAAFLYTLN